MKTWMKKSLIGMVALFGLAAPAVASAEEPCAPMQVGYVRGVHRPEGRWNRRADFRRERRHERFARNRYRRF
jgi:hypothetical protein